MQLFLRIFLFLIIGVSNVYAQKVIAKLALKNKGNISIDSMVVELDWHFISKNIDIKDSTRLSLLDDQGGLIPTQFSYNPNTHSPVLLVYTSIPAHAEKIVRLVTRSETVIQPLVFGRFVPERKDDFAWENNKIAFRMYGKALEGTTENAHGIDIWAKRTSRLIINDWYKSGAYHEDHGEGLDYYSVGKTLGAGNLAPYFSDTVFYPGNFSKWELLENGPLRVRFRLFYDSLNWQGHLLRLQKNITLDAGSMFNRVEVLVEGPQSISIPCVIGIARRPNSDQSFSLVNDKAVSYWEPPHPQYGSIGISIITPTALQPQQQISQWLMPVTLLGKQPFIYYVGATWSKQGDISTSVKWQSYVQQQSLILNGSNPIIINFIK